MSWSKRSKVLAGIAGALLVLALVAAALSPMIARWVVVREARARGVELEFDAITVSWRSVRLRGVRFRLAGVAVLRGGATAMNVEHALLSPRSVGGDGLELSIEGTTVRELAEWAKRFPDAFSLPASMGVAKIEWRRIPGGGATVRVTRGTLDIGARGGTLRGGVHDMRPMGLTFDAGWHLSPESLAVGVFGTDVASAPLRVTFVPEAGADRASIHFDPRAVAVLEPLLALEGIALPKGVAAEGDVELRVLPAPSPSTGTVSLRLTGWIPPHPKELDGIVFGKVTTIQARLSAPGTSATTLADIQKITLKAGVLDLQGSGTIEALAGGPTARLQLSGQIACSELAASALAARLPDVVGDLGGKLARRSLGGNALVQLDVEAELGSLGTARVTPHVALRCKVKLL